MALQMTRSDDEAEIREVFEAWAEAARVKDLDGIMAHYAPDLRAFDAIAQLQFKGADAYRDHWRACLAMCPGEMIFEIHDLNVAIEGDLAFAHCLGRCGGLGDDGQVITSWMRGSVGFRRTGGRWLIVHEHWSAPFDPESGKALLSLEP